MIGGGVLFGLSGELTALRGLRFCLFGELSGISCQLIPAAGGKNLPVEALNFRVAIYLVGRPVPGIWAHCRPGIPNRRLRS